MLPCLNADILAVVASGAVSQAEPVRPITEGALALKCNSCCMGVSPPTSEQCNSSDLNRVAAFMVFSNVGAKLGLYSFNWSI